MEKARVEYEGSCENLDSDGKAKDRSTTSRRFNPEYDNFQVNNSYNMSNLYTNHDRTAIL